MEKNDGFQWLDERLRRENAPKDKTKYEVHKAYMRAYMRRCYFEARVEGIQRYGCGGCGTKDVSRRYRVRVEGRRVEWPWLKRRGWPEATVRCMGCRL